MSAAFVRESPDGVVLGLRVIPRSSSNAVTGIQGDLLKVRVTAPPVDSAANAELIRLLAGILGVPRGSVRILRGASGRRKQVLVSGVTMARVLEGLGPFIAEA
ncbi:MAG: hypothetical protein RIT19_2746 [Verrucomicrobiota bacterium]